MSAWSSVTLVAVGAIASPWAQKIVSAVFADAARQLSLTYWGIRAYSSSIGRLHRDQRWRGGWQITWKAVSETFDPENSEVGELYRRFNMIAIDGVGVTNRGSIPYRFVGKLSRDATIATGTWFDRSDSSGGYHGAFQLRLLGGDDIARGQWIGFSEKSDEIKSGDLIWERLSDWARH